MVRSWLELTDNPDSYMLLMDNGADGLPDPATERRVPLHRGARFVVDTQRLWHVVVHNGDAPRYALITSFETGPALERLDRRQPGRLEAFRCASQTAIWSPTFSADSGGGRDELVESFGWSIPSEGLAGASVEQCGDVVEVVLGVDGQVGAFGEELADEAVPVLVGAALPGRVRVAEVDVRRRWRR